MADIVDDILYNDEEDNMANTDDMTPEEVEAEIAPASGEPPASIRAPVQFGPSTGSIPTEEIADRVHAPDVYGRPELLGGNMQGPSTAMTEQPMLAPNPAREPQAEEEAPEDQVTQAMVQDSITPDLAEIKASMDIQGAPVRKMIADQTALQEADKEIANFATKERERQQQLENDVQALNRRTEEEVRVRSLPEVLANGSFGQKMLAVLAIGMGAVSQGLSGAKENPVLEFIDKQVAAQSARDRLTFEQREMLRRNLVDTSQNLISAAKNRFDNAQAQERLQLEYDKLGVAREKIQAKLNAAFTDKASQVALVTEQMQSGVPVQGSPLEVAAIKKHNQQMIQNISALPAKDAQQLLERKVVLPNGKITFSNANEAQVGNFNKARSDIESAQTTLRDLQYFAKNFTKMDPRDRADMASRLTKLTGQLRESFLGPGAMTATEYERLYGAIGDPAKWSSLAAIESSKLNAVQDVLETDLANKARYMVGLNWPMSKRAQAVQKLQKAGYNPREAAEMTQRLTNRKRP